jgi:hypothetical protein
MDENFKSTLTACGLPEEMVESLQTAFDAKVAEAREEAEMAIREEMTARFEHDKNNLVEAMDLMLTDVVTKHAEEKAAEIAKLAETKAKYDAALVEAKAAYKAKIREHFAAMDTFVVKKLGESVKALAAQKTALAERKAKLDEQFEGVKAEVAAQNADRMAKIENFIARQISRELVEFREDRRSLVETRVKLISEAKAKIAETRAKFIRESAAKVEAAVTENIRREMTQLHEDVERNRQNTFGRRIFEAVAAEFMTSYLAEGTEIRKLQTVLESKETELQAAKTKLNEAATMLDGVARKVKLAEERASRTKIMSELLSNLKGEKKNVMESMLETTKTDQLRATFDRLLPVVLSEGTRKPAERKPLVESPVVTRRVVVTGDKPRLTESAAPETAEVETSPDLAKVLRLAGIQR